MDNYNIPFDDISEGEFLNRAMNDDASMHMGETDDAIIYDEDINTNLLND